MKEKINRIEGIDLVKSLAIFFVISAHYFLNNGFYAEAMQGPRMFISAFLRCMSYTCIPLFIVTTGYLMKEKHLNKKYYKSLLKIIVTYLLISVSTLIVRIYYFHDEITWKSGIKGFFSFSTNAYSWYVNMYIGLFLLIPFLNVLYNNLQTKREKQILILSLVLLTSIVITYRIGRYVPNWWSATFPLTFYFIGAYINEYPLRIRKLFIIILAFLVLLVEAMLAYFDPTFLWFGGDYIYGALPNAIVAICLFLLLYDIIIKNNVLYYILKTISKLTLEIYLVSYIIDRFVYLYLKEFFSSSTEMLPYYAVIVSFIFVVSVILAIMINFIQRKVFDRLY